MQAIACRLHHGACLLLIILLVSSRSASANPVWTKLGAPEGGSSSAMSWAPGNAKIGYSAASGALFISNSTIYGTTDGGATWSSLSQIPNTTTQVPISIAVSPIDPKLVLVTELVSDDFDLPTAFLYRSTDGGHSWTTIFNNEYVTTFVSFDAVSPNIVYASGFMGGTPISTDGGATFPGISSGAASGYLGNLGAPILSVNRGGQSVIYGSYLYSNGGFPDIGGLGLTTDGGATIQKLTLPTLFLGEYFNSIAADPSNPLKIYVLTDVNWPIVPLGQPQPPGGQQPACRLLKSTDGGQTWVLLPSASTLIATQCGPQTIVVDSTNPDHLIVAQDYGDPATPPVLQSFDGGLTWSGAGKNLQSVGVVQLATQSLPSGGTDLWAATLQGLFRSENEGKTWSVVNHGFFHAVTNQILSDPSPTPYVYAATSGGVFRRNSLQTGRWEFASTGLGSLNVVGLALNSAVTPHVLYAATDGGLFYSTDNASTWLHIPGPPTAPDFAQIAIDAKDPARFYALSALDGSLWATGNFGKNWSEMPFVVDGFPQWNGGVFTSPSKPGVMYTWNGPNLIVTKDGGKTFTNIPNPSPSPEATPTYSFGAILPSHEGQPEQILMRNYYSMWASSDDGANWSGGLSGYNCPVDQYLALAVDPSGRRLYGFAEAALTPATFLRRSLTGGKTWENADYTGVPRYAAGPWISTSTLFTASQNTYEIYGLPLGPNP